MKITIDITPPPKIKKIKNKKHNNKKVQSFETDLQLFFSPLHSLFLRRNEMLKFQLEKCVLEEHGGGILCLLVIPYK